MNCTLCILAAGLGSRFKGGIKQLEPFGPNGEIIMDYSIYDALEAGFNKIVFVIRRDIKDAFDEMIGSRISKYANIEYVFQELDMIPEGFTKNPERTKPWGHGHAVLCAASAVNEPVAVINADDFYGKEAYKQLYKFLTAEQPEDKLHLAMAGFILKNTLSEYGAVNRGICIEKDGMLTGVTETYNIRRETDGKVYSGKEEAVEVDENGYASMNMWGLPVTFMDRLKEKFSEFFAQNHDSLTAEFLLPAAIDEMIKSGEADCAVLPSHDRWFGVTYAEDKPGVKAEIAKLIESGVYPEKLWK